MTVLLDTNALLWLSFASERLGKSSKRLIERARNDQNLTVSAISFWEAALLVHKGRVELNQSPSAWRRAVLHLGIREIPLDGFLATEAVALMPFHADPADRFIVATAIHENATLITSDQRILDWTNALARQDATR
ncbi:MAG: type II toxin-antitoxin system VapC family toxin [Rhodospirillales bacterium]